MQVNEWLGNDNQIGIDIWTKKYRYKNENFEEWLDRVSNNSQELRQLIKERKVLFGGRTLSNRNTNKKGSFSNCYSAGYVEDNMNSIMQTAHDLAMTYKAQGGQGISLSKLRPKGTLIGNDYTSDGIVPFMKIFNTVTESVSQGGSRKGALMMSIDIRHKQSDEFITIKSDLDEINKANLSLEIDDKFMNAVQEYYINDNEITLHEVRNYDGHIVEYDIIPIRLYKKMMEMVWDYGEPGCLFTDRLRNFNLMELVDSYEIPTTNPCGEQPLGKHLSCNLCSLNLSEFVTKPYTNEAYFDLPNFIKATRLMVFEMDKVLDENSNNHALKEQKENSLKYRNIGIGIMGLGSALFKLGITYGSEDSITLIDKIMTSMFRSAVFASADNAVNLGSFPAYEECVYDSEIIQKHFSKDEIDELKSKGLRNCSLLSIAPTGSIGTMLNVTTGIEPSFAIHYTRRTDNLNESYEVYCKEAVEWAEINNTTVKNLPKYFVCSADINWRDRINIQAVLQEHVDTAISSTVNLPKETTKEEIEQLYLYAWSKGLKGTTIFRDGCKRLGILTANNNETTQENNLEKIESSTLQRGDILCVNDDLLSCKRTVVNGCGKFYIHCDFDEFTGEPLETFIEVGSGGGCERNLQFISRLISLLLRAGVPVEEIIDQALSIRPCKAYTDRTKSKGDTSKGTSCASAIGYALKELQTKIHNRCFSDDADYEEFEEIVTEYKCNGKCDDTCNCDSEVDKKEIVKIINPCPNCGEELRVEGGCIQCVCGWSKCE